MSVSDQLSRIAPYASRLLEDDYVHEQIGGAVTSLRRGSRRARRKGPKKAVSDRRVRAQLGDAAMAAGQVARILSRPEPPKRHRARLVVAAVVLAGGAAALMRRRNPPPASG